jgi:predicted nucleic acid-binding protein
MAEALVLDASAWLAVLLQEEPYDLIQAHLIHGKLYSPALIRFETTNALLMAERRQRWMTSAKARIEVLQFVRDMAIEEIPPAVWWTRSDALASKHRLSFYDASYLAVADVLDFPLLTLDRGLQKAASAEDVQLLQV